MEEELRTKSGKEKPHPIGAEKKIVSRDKYKLIVLVPPVRRLRVIRVKLEPRSVTIQVEHIRVTIAVYMYAAPSNPPPLE